MVRVQPQGCDGGGVWSEEPLECHPHPQLRGKRNAYSGARAKEISQRALGDLQLLQAGDGRGWGASRIAADAGHVGDTLCIRCHLGCRYRKLDNVDGEVRAWIIAVEKIEEIDERVDLPALFDFERTCNPQV